MKYFADCSWGEEGGTVRGCSLGRPNMGGGTSHPVREAITWGDSSKFQEPRSNQNNSQSLNLINFNLFILQNRRLHLKHYSKPGIVMTINRSTGEVLWRMKAKPDCTGSPKHKVVVRPVPPKIKNLEALKPEVWKSSFLKPEMWNSSFLKSGSQVSQDRINGWACLLTQVNTMLSLTYQSLKISPFLNKKHLKT